MVLISLAAVATAWCGYQAARWSALQALSYNEANAAHIDAATAAARSNAQRMVDVGLFVQYESAIFSERPAFAEFLRKRFRAEFNTALDAWLATHPRTNRNAPLSPFAMREYRLKSDADAARAEKLAADRVKEAVDANEHSDHYVFGTVIFALASFLGGVSVKARYPLNAAISAVGIVMLCAELTLIFRYPVR